MLRDKSLDGRHIGGHDFKPLRQAFDILVAGRAGWVTVEGFADGGFKLGGQGRFQANQRHADFAVCQAHFQPVGGVGIHHHTILLKSEADGGQAVGVGAFAGDKAKFAGDFKKVVSGDIKIAKVSIVGVGMRSHAGVASRMFEALAKESINIQMISTSEIKVSVVIEEKYLELAVRALHTAFDLDAPARQAE